eukprot:TRINITY_DN68123_c2_g4_i1.p1 TRINITY_DN68123_c2_g4~~TRINITY_DN68123_c2_g4_i1.p1  ORF type:complete len:420 (+),score=45.64 TRINITY_DN68123_c2_g4_i1:41-1300(+)
MLRRLVQTLPKQQMHRQMRSIVNVDQAIQYLLTDQQKQFRETTFQFSQKELLPLAGPMDVLPTGMEAPQQHEVWKKIGDMGLFGTTVSPEYGGAGCGYLDAYLVIEEVSRANPSIGLSFFAHDNLCCNQLQLNGTHEQKEKYLPKLISGEHIGALAMSEVTSGSDVVSMKLRAEEKSDHFLLNGTKFWITNGPTADVLLVYAKTAPEKGPHGITTFIIEKGMEGFSIGQKLDKVGMRGSPTGELIFENCRVPKENVLGGLNKGVYVLMRGLEYERLLGAASATGIMQACMDVVIPYTHERKQFGQMIAEFQLMQGKLTDMYTALNASRAYCYSVARAIDAGHVSKRDCAAVFLFAAEKCSDVCGQAVRALGGNGYTNEYPVGRLWRDAKLLEIGGGTCEVRRSLIGTDLNAEFGSRGKM